MDLYEVLGVKKNATQKQLKKAYYAKSKIYHPDQGGNPEMFKQLVQAYGILSDPEKRKRYDLGESAEDISRATMSFDQEVMTSLCGLFVQVVAGSDIQKTDLVALMKRHISQAVAGLENNVKAQKTVVEKFENVVKRIKTSGENNPFLTAANSQIQQCNSTISKIQHQIDIGVGGIKFLDAFSYEFDPTVAQAVQKRRGSSQFVTIDEAGFLDE